MSGLIERLNFCHEYGLFAAAENGMSASPAECIAEIERLRAALAKIAAPRSPCSDAWDDVDLFRRIAMEALGPQ